MTKSYILKFLYRPLILNSFHTQNASLLRLQQSLLTFMWYCLENN